MMMIVMIIMIITHIITTVTVYCIYHPPPIEHSRSTPLSFKQRFNLTVYLTLYDEVQSLSLVTYLFFFALSQQLVKSVPRQSQYSTTLIVTELECIFRFISPDRSFSQSGTDFASYWYQYQIMIKNRGRKKVAVVIIQESKKKITSEFFIKQIKSENYI